MAGWVKRVDPTELQPGREPQGRWKRYVEGERGLIFGLGELAPGESVVHAHAEEEVFYVLSGRGVAEWTEGGVPHSAALAPGDAFFKTTGVHHVLRCVGDAPMRGLYCKV